LAGERVRFIGVIPEGFTTNTSTAPPRFRRNAIWPFGRVSTAVSESALARFIKIPVLAAACCVGDDLLEETFKEATNEIAAIERVSFFPFIPDSFFQQTRRESESNRGALSDSTHDVSMWLVTERRVGLLLGVMFADGPSE
jgi:hypothetical protein